MEDQNQSSAPIDNTLEMPKELVRPLTKPFVGPETKDEAAGSKQPSAVAPSSTDYHAKFADEVHNYVREYIRNADQKASVFFAGASAFLAFLHSKGCTAQWLKDPRTWNIIDVLGFLAMIGLLFGAVILLTVILPRLSGSKRGIIFFNAIVEHDSGTDYANEVQRKSSGELVSAKLNHTFDISKICQKKYTTLHLGFWIGIAGSVFGILFLLFDLGR